MRVGYLVEDGLLRADEAPLEHLLRTVGQLDGVAHVEQLALVVHVGVVAVDLALARERVHDVLADGGRVARQTELQHDGVLLRLVRLSAHLSKRANALGRADPERKTPLST